MHFGFPFQSLADVYASCADSPYPLPERGDVSILARPVLGEGFTLSNALVVQPMEGCDADEGGAPTDWTLRRYERFAAGGSGLLWMEAISVAPEARANPRQLMIREDNVASFAALIARAKEAARKAGWPAPKFIAQLTHSGRFSRPLDAKMPIRAQRNAVLDRHQQLPEDWPIISDAELEALPALFARATRLCRQAGFDGVDVKACHLYLLSELLGALDRPAPYGGCYENRTRLYLQCVDAARAAIGGGILAARVNLYDGEAAAWGVGEGLSLDLAEPLRLLADLRARGVSLVNVTMGTPYFNPHVNRPYARGGYEHPECPTWGVARLLYGCLRAQRAVPDVVCVATGLSYLRHFAPEIAAGLIAAGGARAIGFGRQAFAYPNYAADILREGAMRPERCCLTCGLCTKIMRAGGRPGCPVRDAQWYLPEYRRVLGGGKGGKSEGDGK